MFGLGLPEILVIILAVGVLFFGGRKVVELARSMGRVTGEFKKGRMEMEQELKEMSDSSRDSHGEGKSS